MRKYCVNNFLELETGENKIGKIRTRIQRKNPAIRRSEESCTSKSRSRNCLVFIYNKMSENKIFLIAIN